MSKRRRNHGSSLKGELRQTIQPPQVRISTYHVTAELGDLKERINQLYIKANQRGPESDRLLADHNRVIDRYEKLLNKQMSVIANVCTGLWRIKQNFSQLPVDQMPDKVRKSNRHLEAVMDTLSQAGFSIKDHLREPYDPGMSLHVATYEPTDGIMRETIIETIKPSVYWEDKCIQNAEVIVGTPKQL